LAAVNEMKLELLLLLLLLLLRHNVVQRPPKWN
jgi:hypothetical protein